MDSYLQHEEAGFSAPSEQMGGLDERKGVKVMERLRQ